jgi:hypothetical protein
VFIASFTFHLSVQFNGRAHPRRDGSPKSYRDVFSRCMRRLVVPLVLRGMQPPESLQVPQREIQQAVTENHRNKRLAGVVMVRLVGLFYGLVSGELGRLSV